MFLELTEDEKISLKKKFSTKDREDLMVIRHQAFFIKELTFEIIFKKKPKIRQSFSMGVPTGSLCPKDKDFLLAIEKEVIEVIYD